MLVLSIEKDGLVRCIDETERSFLEHHPVILPTETLYGLACPFGDKDGIMEIFELKGRPRTMTLPIAVADRGMIGKLGDLPEKWRPLIERFLPGPLTIVIKARKDLPEGLARNGTVAVRVPAHPLFGPLIGRVGPLVLTSANMHGRPSVASRKDAVMQFGERCPLMIIDPSDVGGVPSTMIDLTSDRPTVLREGMIGRTDISRFLNEIGKGGGN